MKIKLMAAQGDLTSATALNNATSGDLVMTQKTGSTVIGTMTIPSKAIELISKMPSDTLEGGAGLKAVSIAKSS